MTRAVKVIIVAWVFGLLAAPLVAFALGVRPANIENRTLADAPPFSLSTLGHLEAWKEAANAFSDRLPWRDLLVQAHSAVKLEWLGDSPNPDSVILGRGGWLFLREEFDTCMWADTTPQAVVQAFDLVHAVVETSGRRFRYVIVPAKSTIERDHYRRRSYSFETCSRDHEAALRSLLRGQAGAIDLYPAMLAGKRRGLDWWKRTDTHLDGGGELLITRRIVQSLDPTRWEPQLERLAYTTYAGDLTQMSGLPWQAPAREVVAAHRPRRPFAQPLLALGDSQLYRLGSGLLPYFPHHTLFFFHGLDSGTIDPASVRRARVIVVETVVRYAWTRVRDFPPQLVDALVPDLTFRPGRWIPAPGTVLDRRYGIRLKVPDVSMTVVAAGGDDDRHWRLIRLGLLQPHATDEAAAYVTDQNHAVLPNILSSRALFGRRNVVVLAVPPRYPLRRLLVRVVAPVGSYLEPPAVATLTG